MYQRTAFKYSFSSFAAFWGCLVLFCRQEYQSLFCCCKDISAFLKVESFQTFKESTLHCRMGYEWKIVVFQGLQTSQNLRSQYLSNLQFSNLQSCTQQTTGGHHFKQNKNVSASTSKQHVGDSMQKMGNPFPVSTCGGCKAGTSCPQRPDF